MDLAAPAQFVKGVGPQRAAALAAEGVSTIEDLLFRVPLRYEDRRELSPIGSLRPGQRVSVSGTIAVAGLRRARRLTLYEVRIEDGSGRLKALWFNQPFLKEALPRGARVVLYGTVEPDAYGSRQLMMSSPQYERIDGADDAPGLHTGRIVPIYEKLGPLGGKALRRVLALLAQSIPDDLPDPLPADVRERMQVISRAEALRRLHQPSDEDTLPLLEAARSPAHRRLILEEFFLFQLGLARQREARRERPARNRPGVRRNAARRRERAAVGLADLTARKRGGRDVESRHRLNHQVH